MTPQITGNGHSATPLFTKRANRDMGGKYVEKRDRQGKLILRLVMPPRKKSSARKLLKSRYRVTDTHMSFKAWVNQCALNAGQ